MKGEASSRKAYHNDRLMDVHPRIFDVSLLLGLILLICLAAFLISDILSSGLNPAHKDFMSRLDSHGGGQSILALIHWSEQRMEQAASGYLLPANGSKEISQNLSIPKNASVIANSMGSSNSTGNGTSLSHGASGVSTAGRTQPWARTPPLVFGGSDDSSSGDDGPSYTPPAKPARNISTQRNDSQLSRSLLNESSISTPGNSSANSSVDLAAPGKVQVPAALSSSILPSNRSIAASGQKASQGASHTEVANETRQTGAKDETPQTQKRLIFPSATEGQKKAGSDGARKESITAPASKTKKKLQAARDQITSSRDKLSGSMKRKVPSSRSAASRPRKSAK
jgi:hypothetical protein